MSKKSPSVGNRIYGGAAIFGRFTTLISAILLTILGGVLIYFGVGWLNLDYDSVNAKIIDMNCIPKKCTLNVTYTYKDKLNIRFIETGSNKNISKGDEIPIYIDKNDYNNVTNDNPKTVAKILIGVGIFIILLGWFFYWLARKYEFAAAAFGVGDALHMFRW